MGQPQSTCPDTLFARLHRRATGNRGRGAAPPAPPAAPTATTGGSAGAGLGDAVSPRNDTPLSINDYSRSSLFDPSSSCSCTSDEALTQGSDSDGWSSRGPAPCGCMESVARYWRTSCGRGGGSGEGLHTPRSSPTTSSSPAPTAYTYSGEGGRLYRFHHGLPTFPAATGCTSCLYVPASRGNGTVGGMVYHLRRRCVGDAVEGKVGAGPPSKTADRAKDTAKVVKEPGGSNPLAPCPAGDEGRGGGRGRTRDPPPTAKHDVGGSVSSGGRPKPSKPSKPARRYAEPTIAARIASAFSRVCVKPVVQAREPVVEDATWAFYNDIPDRSARVRVVFGADAEISALGTTRLQRGLEEGGDSTTDRGAGGSSVSAERRGRGALPWVAETVVPPLATALFIEGRVKGGYRLRCVLVDGEDLSTRAVDGDDGDSGSSSSEEVDLACPDDEAAAEWGLPSSPRKSTTPCAPPTDSDAAPAAARPPSEPPQPADSGRRPPLPPPVIDAGGPAAASSAPASVGPPPLAASTPAQAPPSDGGPCRGDGRDGAGKHRAVAASGGGAVVFPSDPPGPTPPSANGWPPAALAAVRPAARSPATTPAHRHGSWLTSSDCTVDVDVGEGAGAGAGGAQTSVVEACARAYQRQPAPWEGAGRVRWAAGPTGATGVPPSRSAPVGGAVGPTAPLQSLQPDDAPGAVG